LEDLDAEVEINSAWETIRENIKMSAKESPGFYEPKQHNPWFDEGCSELSDQRKQAKLQWLQDPSEINGDNLNNVRRQASRHFRNKSMSLQEHNLYQRKSRGGGVDPHNCPPHIYPKDPTMKRNAFIPKHKLFSYSG
jgi:hypothetical protein